MSIRDVIVAVNHMEKHGVFERYAIGGAVGATFYLEPVATLDIDLFVTFRAMGESALLSLQPIYDYLIASGASMKGEYVLIAGWPVQFLPPTGPLVEEALLEAVQADVDGVSARVFTAEHLAAIALQTGRARDKARLLQFIEEGALDRELFEAIVQRHHLVDPWERFQQQFIPEAR